MMNYLEEARLQNKMEYNVIYNNKKAILTGYFDSKCLLFDMKDGKPDFDGIKIIENYPEGYYCVFFSQIPIEERMKIRLDNGQLLMQECVCSLFFDDRPNSPLLQEYVEIIGDDPIDYESMGDYADSSKYATVKCKICGKVYRVNKNSGYRTSFIKWTVSQDKI